MKSSPRFDTMLPMSMGSRARILLGASIACLVLVLPSIAHARRGVLIWGGGETVSHVADADFSGDPELAAALAFDEPAIGYKYEYFSLFFLDLWTGGGELVLYDQSDDRYAPLSDEVLLELTGRTPDSFGKPLLYRVPLGWVVIGVALIALGVTTWRRMRELP